MTRSHVNIAIGLTLIVLSLVVYVGQGVAGFVATAVVSMALLIAGVALVANRNTHWRELRPRLKKSPKWGTGGRGE